MNDDDDLPRHILQALPRVAIADRPAAAFVRLAAAARRRRPRTCRACGGPMRGTQAFCSLQCFRAGDASATERGGL